MATISNTPRPGYVWDATDNCWYPIGTGPHTHAYIPESIVDAKGDLISATADNTPARLAVGNNGDTLLADSSTSTGLRYTANFAAGKNKIINGDFGIWQRGTTFSTNAAYTADRWELIFDGAGATRAITQQTFTPGTAPVSGYEGQYFYRYNQSVAGSTGSYNIVRTKMEDVRTFAGQTVTVSFWAKAAASTTMTSIYLTQNFGSGGSAGVDAVLVSSPTFTTSWVRYSYTAAVPSIAGKTIGTNNCLELRINFPLNATFTVDIWGVQAESGSVATAFQTATGTLAGELAACQRYYVRFGANSVTPFQALGYAYANSTTIAYANIPLPVQMRTTPTTIDSANAIRLQSNVNVTITTIAYGNVGASPTAGGLYITTPASLTAGNAYLVCADNNNTAYIGFSAEL